MTRHFRRMAAIVLFLTTAMPLYAHAQTPAEIEAAKKKAAPAARSAAPPPAARPAAPPQAARPAPVARQAPPVAGPAAPPAAARIAPQRREAPAARSAPPQAPAARAVQRQDRYQERIQQRVQQRQERAGRPQAPARAATPQPAPNAVQSAARPNAPAAAQRAATPAQARIQQRQERLLQRREDRALRNVPPAQRAARREQIQQQRQERAAQRQGIQPNAQRGIAQPNAAAAPNAQRGIAANAGRDRGLRRNGQARITPQAARQGRFANRYTGDANAQARSGNRQNARAAFPQARIARYAPRRAWQRGIRAAFVPWYGPVFWPYAYSDIFSYTFFPAGYEDTYWDYAYDDFFDGVFYGEVGPPVEYVTETTGSAPVRAATPSQPTYAAVRDLCATPGSGITAWPTAEIESKVGLNAEQKQLLGDVKDAGSKAAAVFKATCPSENSFPLTPPGRLAAMTGRLDATLQAVQIVKPALETFYNALNDEQKERFNQIGPSKAATGAEAQSASADDAKKCGEAKPGLTNLPIEQIEDVLGPNDAQQADLDRLGEATVKAVGILQAACPAETPLTPPGRLQAIETRLQAMIEAANAVKPALGSFYAALTAEQKARFNRLGRELAQADAAKQ